MVGPFSMVGKDFIQSIILAGAMTFGAASPAFADDAEYTKANLKQDISTAFNTVSAKVVKFTELKAAFSVVASKKLGLLERMKANSKIAEFEKAPAAAGNGVIVEKDADGKSTVYLHAQYIQAALVKAIDDGDADGHEQSMKKIGLATAEAIEQVADQSAKAKPVTMAAFMPKR